MIPAGLDPVHLRHLGIHQYQIGLQPFRRRYCFNTVPNDSNDLYVPLTVKHASQAIRCRIAIVSNQYTDSLQ